MSSPAETRTVTAADRAAGAIGPAPLDEHTEIRWARMGTRDVVVKAARHPNRSRLRREAEVLQRIAEGAQAACMAVGFVELVEGADHTELVTLRHGTVTLAEVGLLSPTERTRALLSLCETLGDLHAAGWVHGSLRADHVLVDPGAPMGSPGLDAPAHAVRLCSLGEAEQLADPLSDATRSADIEALGTVVREALEAPVGFGTGRERRRYEAAARKAHKRLTAARGLHDGHTIAKVLAETIGRQIERSPRRRAPGHRRRWNTLVVAGAIVSCLVAGAVVARTLHRSDRDPTECSVEFAGRSHACGNVTVQDNVVSIGAQRFELGAPGDIVRVGDWDCDGTGTAVLLESTTGRLFHFANWSTDSREVTGEQIGGFEGATGLSNSGACRYPEVALADGSRITPLEETRRAPGDNG